MLHFYQSNKKWGVQKVFSRNVRVCPLCRRFLGGSLEGAGVNSPMGRIAESEEIGRVVMGMCDPKLTFLNGDDVKADGASSA